MMRGSCLCEKVTLSFDNFVRPFKACHCVQCRKQTGTYVTAGHVLDQQLVVEGEENISWYAASNEAKRGFCSTCGSLLLWKLHGTDYTSVMAGCIDGKTHTPLTKHIFTADKGDYYELGDGVPQLPGSDR